MKSSKNLISWAELAMLFFAIGFAIGRISVRVENTSPFKPETQTEYSHEKFRLEDVWGGYELYEAVTCIYQGH